MTRDGRCSKTARHVKRVEFPPLVEPPLRQRGHVCDVSWKLRPAEWKVSSTRRGFFVSWDSPARYNKHGMVRESASTNVQVCRIFQISTCTYAHMHEHHHTHMSYETDAHICLHFPLLLSRKQNYLETVVDQIHNSGSYHWV